MLPCSHVAVQSNVDGCFWLRILYLYILCRACIDEDLVLIIDEDVMAYENKKTIATNSGDDEYCCK